MAPLRLLFRLFGRFDDFVSRPLLLLVIIAVYGYGISRYLDLIQPSVVAKPVAPTLTSDSGPDRFRFMSVAQLFEHLLDSDLIRFDKITGLLVLPYADGWLRCRAANQHLAQGAEREPVLSGRVLLKTLFETPAGFEIRQAAERWNASQFFAAIRDKRPPLKSIDGMPASVSGLRRNNSWQALGEHGLRLSSNAQVPESFGFVNRSLQAGFSDWVSASHVRYLPASAASWPDCALPAGGNGIPVTFVSETRYPRTTTLDLQVIGHIQSLSIDGQKLVAINDLFEPRCPRSVRAYPCRPDQVLAAASHKEQAIRLPAGQHQLTVIVEPVASGLQRIDGLPIQRLERTNGRIALQWQSWPRAGQRGSYQIVTADATALTDKVGRGIPTEQAQKLGLTPLVGLDGRHYSSLIGILNRSVPAREHWQVVLTIDANLQAQAQAALQETIPHLFPGPGEGQSERYADDRRGVLLVTDVDSGAILANASYPPLPAGVHPWDHYSFLRTQSFRSPLSVMAWQNMSRHATPGSAFKLATALALLNAPNDKHLSELIHGIDKKRFKAVFGPLQNVRFPVFIPGEERPRYIGKADAVIDKFSKVPRRTAVSEDGNCLQLDQAKQVSSSQRIGLAEALRDSLNHWFIHLINAIDGGAAKRYDTARYAAQGRIEHYPLAPQFELVAMARRLGLLQQYNLAAPITRALGVQRVAPKHTVLFADAGRLSLNEQAGGLPQYPMSWVLAQNAIGQGVQLSPLHMTRLAAAIASGRLPPPSLLRIQRFRADQVLLTTDPVVEFASLELGQKQLLIQRGMKAVVDAGTARRAFASTDFPPCRVYGKTGTAQLEKRGGKGGREPFNSAWFVGYALPSGEQAPRIAFACLVSHAPHGKNDTGGKVCAPIVANFLSRLSDYR